MGGYFKPWRRKIGVVTLALACALLGAWARSFIHGDCFVFMILDSYLTKDGRGSQEEQGNLLIMSIVGNVCVCPPGPASISFVERRGRLVQSSFSYCGHEVIEANFGQIADPGSTGIPSAWNWVGAQIHEVADGAYRYVINYWSFVFPLTLISAWLLLSKIRDPKATTKPAPSKAWTAQEFFRGWKRKFGGVALVLACGFATAWVRSNYVVDEWVYENEDAKFYAKKFYLVSCPSGLKSVRRTGREHWAASNTFWQIGWRITNIEAIELTDTVPDGWESERHWELCGFKFGRYAFLNGPGASEPIAETARIWVVPHWSIVVPSTLLSVWLLLSRRRPVTSVQTSAPQVTQG